MFAFQLLPAMSFNVPTTEYGDALFKPRTGSEDKACQLCNRYMAAGLIEDGLALYLTVVKLIQRLSVLNRKVKTWNRVIGGMGSSVLAERPEACRTIIRPIQNSRH